MTNTFAPFGFRFLRMINASAPNYAPRPRKISASDTTPIFRGDVVASTAQGFITALTSGAAQVAGIFAGCQYLSVSIGRTVYSPFWPGSDAAGDITAFVIDAPDAEFVVQSGNGGPFTQADVGLNVAVGLGTGNTRNGISGQYADFATAATTATLPFRITGFAGDGLAPALVGNGSDGTTPFNLLYVTFNNQDFKTQTGV